MWASLARGGDCNISILGMYKAWFILYFVMGQSKMRIRKGKQNNNNTFHGQNSLVEILFFQIVSNIYNRETIIFDIKYQEENTGELGNWMASHLLTQINIYASENHNFIILLSFCVGKEITNDIIFGIQNH